MTPTPDSPAARWQRLLVACAILAFIVLAAYRLDRPGLYADEMIFGPVAYRVAGQCDIVAGVSSGFGKCFPTYMDPPYLGALKAYLHVPLLKTFGPSVWTLRLPSILISGLSLALLFGVLRRALSPAFATAAVVCLALDPMFVFVSHFDWGPVVLSTLFRILLLGAVWRWLDGGAPRDLAWAAVFAVLGMYDKLNFVWVLIAFTAAVLAVDARRAIGHLRAAPVAAAKVLLPTAVVMAWFLFAKILPATRLEFHGNSAVFDASVQWTKLVEFYNDTYAGTFPRNWISEQPGRVPRWPWRLLMVEFAAVALLASRRPWRIAGLLSRWRATVFVAVALVVLLALMFATRQLAGTHHLWSAWPFPTLLLLLLVDLGLAWWSLERPSRRAADLALAGVALLVVLAGAPAHSQQRQLWRGKFGFRSPLDPAMAQLSDAINRRPEGTVMATDWGFHEPLVTLSPKRQRKRFVNFWSSFSFAADHDPAHTIWLRDAFLKSGSHWLLTYAEGREVMPDTRRHLADFLIAWGGCLTLDETVAGINGKPEYQIWRYDADRQCTAADVPASLQQPAP